MSKNLSAQQSLFIRLGLEFVLWTSVVIIALSIPLIVGQLLRLRTVLFPLSVSEFSQLINLIVGGTFILLEVSLPIALFISSLLVVRRWRILGLSQTWLLLGYSPLRILYPLLFVAGLCSLGGLYLSHELTPKTLRKLSKEVTMISEKNWRKLLPHALTKFHQEIEKSGLKKQGKSKLFYEDTPTPETKSASMIWLLEDKDNQLNSRFSYLACDLSHLILKNKQLGLVEPCMSAWWSAMDEEEDQVTIHGISYTRIIGNLPIKINLKQLTLPRPPLSLERVRSTFGPPNSLKSIELDHHNIQQSFIYHKRWALPWYSLFFTFLGAFLGLTQNLRSSLLVSLLIFGGSFGLLRFLELAARAGYGSPTLAAWCPLMLLGAGCLLGINYLLGNGHIR